MVTWVFFLLQGERFRYHLQVGEVVLDQSLKEIYRDFDKSSHRNWIGNFAGSGRRSHDLPSNFKNLLIKDRFATGSFGPETIFGWIRFASTSTWSVEDPRLLRRDLGMVRVLSSKPHQKRGSRR